MSDNEIKLAINKTINAPVEKVFDAWIDPHKMKQWFAPGAMTVPNAESDPRIGGEYLIHMHDTDAGSDHIVSGSYEEFIPNRKLVFNWKWKDGVDRTQVTVDFASMEENKTLLTLTHRGFSQEEFRDKHNQGWGACLDNLAKYFT